MRRLLFGTLVVAAIALPTACAGPTAAQPGVAVRPALSADGAQHVTVKVGNSMSFEPSHIALKAGQPVELALQNTGFLQHDFTLTSGVDRPVTVAVGGGKTVRAAFTIERPGTYTFLCSVPGHAENGMRGTLTVE